MKVNSVAIDLIIPYEKNPRVNNAAITKVAASLKEYGFQQPIVVDSQMIVIAGHTRLLAAKKLGITEIPIVIANSLNPQQIKAYRLADNRTAQESTWNMDLLAEELLSLQNDDFEMSLTGFDTSEIDQLLNPIAEMEDDEFESKITLDSRSKLGDLWILGSHLLLCGDAANPEHYACLTQENTPILMVTDPPYGVNYDPEWRDGADLGVGERSKGKVLNDDEYDWSPAYALFTGDVTYIWHAGKHTAAVAKSIIECGYQIISQIIWAKQHFVLSRGDYHWQHEPCWYAVRNGKKHNWQGLRDQSTVWDIKNNNSWGNSDKEEMSGHSTQKPIECMLRPILNNSQHGDYVYDPFGGSGTTLIACEKSNRNCLMMELSPSYVDAIIARWEKLTGKTAVLQS